MKAFSSTVAPVGSGDIVPAQKWRKCPFFLQKLQVMWLEAYSCLSRLRRLSLNVARCTEFCPNRRPAWPDGSLLDESAPGGGPCTSMGMVTGELSLGREYIRGLVAVSAICSLGVVVPTVMSGPHIGVLACGGDA